MKKKIRITGVVMAALLLIAMPASAQDAALETRRAALQLLTEGDFAGALERYSAALSLSTDPENVALANRGRARSYEGQILTTVDDAVRVTRYEGAIEAYQVARQAISAVPHPIEGMTDEGLTARIHALEAPLAELRHRIEASRHATAPPPIIPTTPRLQPTRSHMLAWMLVATGGVLMIGGGVLGGFCLDSGADVRAIQDRMIYQPNATAVAVHDATCATWPIALGVGAATTGAGIILRLARGGSIERSATPTVAPTFHATANGVSGGLILRF